MALKIGDFAKLAGVSVRMLRHYDRLDLLKPARINGDTGYRYYTKDQLVDLHRIRDFQALGFTLKEIQSLRWMDDEGDIHKQLWQRQKDIQQEIHDQKRRLVELQRRMTKIENGHPATNNQFIVQQVASEIIVGHQSPLEEDSEIFNNFASFADYMDTHQIPVLRAMGIKHGEYDSSGIFEWAFQLADMNFKQLSISPDIRLNKRKLDSTLMARSVIQGSYQQSVPCFNGFADWAEAHNFEVAGATREIYLRVVDGDIFHPDNLIEIQIPIKPRH